jgi:hypothetical protein
MREVIFMKVIKQPWNCFTEIVTNIGGDFRYNTLRIIVLKRIGGYTVREHMIQLGYIEYIRLGRE